MGPAWPAWRGWAGRPPAGPCWRRCWRRSSTPARPASIRPGGELKLNAVITRRGNADQLLPLAALAREQGLELRLIEFMDVGNRNGWRPEAGAAGGRDGGPHRRELAAGAGGPGAPRHRQPLALPRPVCRRRGPGAPPGRGGLDHGALLRRLQPPAGHRRRGRLHLPVRRQRHRPAALAAAPARSGRAGGGVAGTLAGAAGIAGARNGRTRGSRRGEALPGTPRWPTWAAEPWRRGGRAPAPARACRRGCRSGDRPGRG